MTPDSADGNPPPRLAPARRWARTGDTQRRILDAATEVFGARGFTAATMADVVSRSGASIGSIYHHFGGKKDLFLAIFERLSTDVETRITAAARVAGECEPRQAFEIHTRAYLQAMWANRRAARVLAADDTPAGFDRVRRSSMMSGLKRWMSVLDIEDSPRGQLLTRVLIAIMTESTLMVAMCRRAEDAAPIIDTTIELIDRLTG